MSTKDEVLEAVAKASGVTRGEIELELPENDLFGDYSTNIALILAKKEGKNPQELASELVEKINLESGLPAKVEARAGFINFWLNREVLLKNLQEIAREKEKFGKSQILKGKKIILEFTDPNPFKEFHIGHLYTNTVGEALARLIEAGGAQVKRANYQGDVGLHVAKAIWGMVNKMREDNLTLQKLGEKSLAERIKFMGEAYALGARAYEEDKVAQGEMNSLNQKIFEKDPEIKDLYESGRKWSLEYFEGLYKRLGTKFDFYYFESEVGKAGEEIVRKNLKKGIFEKSKGAVIFPGSKYGFHDRVFINSLGLPTYEAKEIGLAPAKYKDFPYDLSIIITGNEINEYFKVLIKVISLIYPDLGKKAMHIGHGMVRFPEGKMGSRTGNVVTAEMLLQEVKSETEKINESSSEAVTVGAVKYAFLKVGIGKDITYNVNESLSLEGNSGPYLQYTAARCNSVLVKAGLKGVSFTAARSNGSPAKVGLKGVSSKAGYNLKAEEASILRSLFRFSAVIEIATKSYSPNLLCNYLYDLASKYNNFYNADRIIGSENQDFRLALTAGVGQILKNGLGLLGIETPEKM